MLDYRRTGPLAEVVGKAGLVLAGLLLLTAGAVAAQDRLDRDSLRKAAQILALEVDTALAAVPQELFDPGMLAASIGSDPNDLRSWVTENTGLVPYHGSLKGASGVLVDREGNSLDRALLLASLLQTNGHNVRLARARLSPEQAELLLAAVGPARVWDLPNAREPDAAALIQAVANGTGLAPDLLAPYISAPLERAVANQEALYTRQDRLLPLIRARLEALVRPDPGPRDERSVQLAALGDHWWVEYDEAGQWRALDATEPPFGERMQPSESISLDGIPPDLKHRVEISVVVEMSGPEGTDTHDLLTVVEAASAFRGDIAALTFLPLGALSVSAGPAVESDEILASIENWVPVLAIGAEDRTELGFRMDGRIETADRLRVTSPVIGPLEDAIDLFGSLPDGSGDTADEDSNGKGRRLTAAWIDLRVLPVVADPVHARRMIPTAPRFDSRGFPRAA